MAQLGKTPSQKGTAKQPTQYGGQPATSLADVGAPPTAAQVASFHVNADTDVRSESIHHTLGNTPFQASPGDHTHDGGSSAQLLAGQTLTGSKGANAAVSSIVAALVRLGATDSTT